ncbi:MAG TPA: methyltransferase MtaB domain-containing protein [Patescibacteria group bacterium]|nr:methyltransferase MtaB domain-containing protein [Patescibacteria group bacterium]
MTDATCSAVVERSAPASHSAPLVRSFGRLAITDLEDFVFGRSAAPVDCGHGVIVGDGIVLPELNFTLPPVAIGEDTWPAIRRQYEGILERACLRAAALEIPGLLVEFEALPDMTVEPAWALDIVAVLAEGLERQRRQTGLKAALRFTPGDVREFERPPRLRGGRYWEAMMRVFDGASAAGADLVAIESTGGKEVSDVALTSVDLAATAFALGVLGARDMEFLWDEIVAACRRGGIVASGDSACGFANTAMALADQGMIPRVFAAVVRVAAVPRSLVAFERGATGPSKDCAYEGPYLKAIAGVPIAMEGKSAACAHLSHVGNIAAAVADVWSNESVQDVRLLSTFAPTVSLEQLAYDCRLMNIASSRSPSDARRLRDWLTESDAALDPQAWVLRPDVVLRLAAEIVAEPTPYLRTRRAIRAALDELHRAHGAGELRVPAREVRWLDLLRSQAEALPEDEEQLAAGVSATLNDGLFLPAEYAPASA